MCAKGRRVKRATRRTQLESSIAACRAAEWHLQMTRLRAAPSANLYPPGVGGADLSANTRVSSPAAGVAPGQIKSALNNSTSNIGIPYHRLVPLNNSNKLIGVDENGKTVTRKETEDLRATSLAFILGIRGDTKPPRPLLVGNEQAPGIPGYVAYQPSLCRHGGYGALPAAVLHRVPARVL